MKKNYLRKTLFLAAISILAACTKKLELPGGEPKIVLLGELVAGDSIYFRAGKSTVLKSGADNALELISGLDITVSKKDGGSWPLNHEEDDLSANEFTLAYFSGQQVQESGRYTVTAKHARLGTAVAEVPVPAAFDAGVEDTASVVYQGFDCIQADLSFHDLPGAENFYCIEVVQQPYTVEPSFFYEGEWLKMSDYFELFDSLESAGVTVEQRIDTFYMRMFGRVPFMATDMLSEHVKNGKAGRETNRMIMSDKEFAGAVHNTSLFIPRKNIMPGTPGFFGYKTFIQVKSVSPDYFAYLKAYEETDRLLGFDEFSSKVRLSGNVQNGLGVIGGVFRRQFGFDF